MSRRPPRSTLFPTRRSSDLGVDDEAAAGLLLQGLTAYALVHRCARLSEGETIVVAAAAGGTGTLAVQLAKRAGGRSEEHTSELQSRLHLVCRLLLEKKTKLP